jgi:hypothetical protein
MQGRKIDKAVNGPILARRKVSDIENQKLAHLKSDTQVHTLHADRYLPPYKDPGKANYSIL